jgi:hypothetical protein
LEDVARANFWIGGLPYLAPSWRQTLFRRQAPCAKPIAIRISGDKLLKSVLERKFELLLSLIGLFIGSEDLDGLEYLDGLLIGSGVEYLNKLLRRTSCCAASLSSRRPLSAGVRTFGERHNPISLALCRVGLQAMFRDGDDGVRGIFAVIGAGVLACAGLRGIDAATCVILSAAICAILSAM